MPSMWRLRAPPSVCGACTVRGLCHSLILHLTVACQSARELCSRATVRGPARDAIDAFHMALESPAERVQIVHWLRLLHMPAHPACIVRESQDATELC